MIIKNVCLLLEALSFVICLHYLYGEKFRLDIVTVSYLSIHMIIMTAINYLEMPKTCTMIMYLIIIVYCGVRFGIRLKALVVNMILCIILVGVTQLLVVYSFSHLMRMTLIADYQLLVINFISASIIIFLLPLCRIRKLSFYLKDKGKILVITVCTCVCMVLFLLVSYKEVKVIEVESIIILLVSIIFIFVLSGQLIKYKIKAKEVETELKIQRIYADSFKGMIDDIRLRQHEFNNHIHMMHTMHLKYNTYETLVGALKDYGSAVIEENRFHRLLSSGNSVIIGYLYGCFVEFDKAGIEISYQVSIQELEIRIPIHKIVEILGDLMNNAVEALLADGERKRLHVSVIENDRFYIEVRNESAYIPYKEIGNFFVKDYSRKGENRGLGLYNVKQICEEYGLDISCDNVDVDGCNWITFVIRNEKETT